MAENKKIWEKTDSEVFEFPVDSQNLVEIVM